MSKKSIAEKASKLTFVDADRLAQVLKLCREAARRGYEAGLEQEHRPIDMTTTKWKSQALRQIIHGGKR